MTKPTNDELRAAIGNRALDRDDQQIGTVADFYLDADSDDPEWVLVALEGATATRTFVPLAEATLAAGSLRISFDGATVRDAPRFDADEVLSESDEHTLYEYYGLAYTGGPSDNTMFEGAGLSTVDEALGAGGAPLADEAAAGSDQLAPAAPTRRPSKLVRMSGLGGAATPAVAPDSDDGPAPGAPAAVDTPRKDAPSAVDPADAPVPAAAEASVAEPAWVASPPEASAAGREPADASIPAGADDRPGGAGDPAPWTASPPPPSRDQERPSGRPAVPVGALAALGGAVVVFVLLRQRRARRRAQHQIPAALADSARRLWGRRSG